MASYMDNGNKDTPPELDPHIVKVVIIGDAKCGKTSFIRAFYDNNSPGEIYSHNGIRIYPCEFDFNGKPRGIALYEIPSHPEFEELQRVDHYLNAYIYVFMYAFDNPLSLKSLKDHWIPEAQSAVNLSSKPVVILGNKKDLIDNPQVLERLAIANQAPITDNQVQPLGEEFQGSMMSVECCSCDVEDVDKVFRTILHMATHEE